MANEGLPSINYMIGNGRRLDICKQDLIILLNNTDPLKPPLLTELTDETQSVVNKLCKISIIISFTKTVFNFPLKTNSCWQLCIEM